MGVDCNILSPSAFDDLVAAVGEEFVPTLMAVFVSDLSDVATKASAAAASGDPLAFATQMHALRGTSASIGAMLLSEISSRYDRLSATDTVDLHAVWSELEPVLLATLAAVSAISNGEHL